MIITDDREASPQERELTFGEALQALVHAQKPGYGVPAYMRWVNRPAARPLAAASYRLGMTPNGVTGASAMISALGLATLVFLERAPMVGVLAAVLLALGFALDSADGQLARLTGTGGPAGEWMDHVVDAIRTPALHLTVLLVLLARDGWSPYLAVPVVFCLSSVGHFMSQILAEQLKRSSGEKSAAQPSGPGRSFLLLPVDTGVLCWIFVLWGFPTLFAVSYALLAGAQLAISGVSMRRKYAELRGLSAAESS